MTFYLEVGGMKESEKGGQFKFLKKKKQDKNKTTTRKILKMDLLPAVNKKPSVRQK